MANPREKLASCDPVWERLRQEAETIAEREPALASFVHAADPASMTGWRMRSAIIWPRSWAVTIFRR